MVGADCVDWPLISRADMIVTMMEKDKDDTDDLRSYGAESREQMRKMKQTNRWLPKFRKNFLFEKKKNSKFEKLE